MGSFLMKRTAYVEIPNNKTVIIGTPYLKKEFDFSRFRDGAHKEIDLVGLIECTYSRSPSSFYVNIHKDSKTSTISARVMYVENGKYQEIGTIKIGETKRFTCVVTEKT